MGQIQWDVNQNKVNSVHENVFENDVCKLLAILFMSPCVTDITVELKTVSPWWRSSVISVWKPCDVRFDFCLDKQKSQTSVTRFSCLDCSRSKQPISPYIFTLYEIKWNLINRERPSLMLSNHDITKPTGRDDSAIMIVIIFRDIYCMGKGNWWDQCVSSYAPMRLEKLIK